MSDTQPDDPLTVAWTVSQILDGLDIEHTIGGSIAASFAGEPRSTIDIDFVAAVEESQVPALVSALEPGFYVNESALRRAIQDRGTVNLIHQSTQLKVDLFIAGGTPLDAQQLRRRQPVTVGVGRVLHVHPPEDILLQKLRWYHRGGRVSDRQWRDILGIIRVQGEHLDLDYARKNAPALGVEDLLTRALDETS